MSRRRLAALGTSSRSNSSCFATEKIVVFAAIASARDVAAASVNPGLLRSRRAANTSSGGKTADIRIIYPKTIIEDRRGCSGKSCAHGDVTPRSHTRSRYLADEDWVSEGCL